MFAPMTKLLYFAAEMKTQANTGADLQANRKDVSYPVFDLPEALKIATAVKELGGTRSTVAKSVLAQHLKLPAG